MGSWRDCVEWCACCGRDCCCRHVGVDWPLLVQGPIRGAVMKSLLLVVLEAWQTIGFVNMKLAECVLEGMGEQ